MNTIDVSVIIPVYGVEKYLQQCIDSLLDQSLQSCEYIFVNDASPDHCLDILRENEKLHPDKIRIIDSAENLRQGGARNIGLKAARGEYIGYVDSDDFVHPQMFRELYEKAVETGADATFIQYASVEDDAVYSREFLQNQHPPIFEWDKRIIDCAEAKLTDKMISDLMSLPVGGVYCGIYRREWLLGTKVEFPEKIRYEDNYWGTLIKPYLTKVAFIPSVRYYYRQNNSSTTHARNQIFQYNDRVSVERALVSEAERRGLLDRFHDAFEWIYIFRYALNTFYTYVGMFDRPDDKLLRVLMKDLRQRFPGWYRNPYFKSEFSRKHQIKHKLIILFPAFTRRYLHLKYLLQERIRSSKSEVV